MRFRAGAVGIALLTLGGVAPSASAQEPIPDHRLFTSADLLLAAGFAGGTIGMFPLDRSVIGAVRDSARVHSPAFQRTARVFGFLGSPGTFIAIAGLYGAGRIADERRLEELAVHGAEGVLAGLVVAGALKTILGRSRPFATADTNPRDFRLFRGFRSDDFQAFPSGHTTTAFAFAAAITADVHGRNAEGAWVIGPLLYGGAALTGVSRMYEDKHWASDVVMGAAIGTFAGLKAVRFTRTRTGRRLERRLLGEPVQLRFTVPW